MENDEMTNDAAVVRYDPWIRYDLDTNGTPCMERILYGDYVRVEDYWALATTVAELRTEVERLRQDYYDTEQMWLAERGRADAAERRVAELHGVLSDAVGRLYRIDINRLDAGETHKLDGLLDRLQTVLTKESPLRQEKPE